MRRTGWVRIVLVLLAVALGWWLFQVAQLGGEARDSASGYGAFVLAAAAVVVGLIGPLGWRGRPEQVDLDSLSDGLASEMRIQWEKEARRRYLRYPAPLSIQWHRSERPVAGPIASATTSGVFAPLPGLRRTTADHLRSGTNQSLHGVYGGLSSGRLIISGDSGSGKTSVAVLLVLDALEHRRGAPPGDRALIPVPVMLSLAGWDPETTPIADWLVSHLTDFPPLSGRGGRERAAALLAAGRITVVLDALDELPEHHRAVAVSALADQATFRLVLLTGTAELVAATRDHILTGAACVELRPITRARAITYLQHGLPSPPPDHWQRLLDALTAGTVIAEAVTNPLTVTLLRNHDVRDPSIDLLNPARFPTPEAITDHLVDRMVVTAYTTNSGDPSPWPAELAEHTLTGIASYLHRTESRDLHWWAIPSWVPTVPRIALFVGMCVLLTSVGTAAILLIASGAMAWLYLSMSFGTAVVIGLFTALIAPLPPTRLGRFTPRRVRWRLVFVASAVMCLPIALTSGWQGGGIAGITLFVVFAFVTGSIDGESRRAPTPEDQIRADLAFGAALGVGVAPVIGLAVMFLHSPILGALSLGVTAPLIAFSSSRALGVVACLPYLALRYGLPWRTLAFLHDARERNLFRTVGAVYQFRHGKLQDRLALRLDHPATDGP